MAGGLEITGVNELRKLAADLSAAGSRGRRFRSRLRRNIVITTAPITSEAQAGWSGGYGALGAALAAATRTRVRTSSRGVGVSVIVDAGKMPPNQLALPVLVEGLRAWRHPRWGDRNHWYPQDARPELGPAVRHHIPGVQAGVIAAVEQTAEALARGSAK